LVSWSHEAVEFLWKGPVLSSSPPFLTCFSPHYTYPLLLTWTLINDCRFFFPSSNQGLLPSEFPLLKFACGSLASPLDFGANYFFFVGFPDSLFLEVLQRFGFSGSLSRAFFSFELRQGISRNVVWSLHRR